jgi:acetyltransferase-like isoleucine patch superfamily enzyme
MIMDSTGLVESEQRDPGPDAVVEIRPPAPQFYRIIGLDQSWVLGTATIEAPAQPFAGFGCLGSLAFGAFSYSSSHITTHVASVGRYCSIADGIQFGHEEHPTKWLATSSFTYDAKFMSLTDEPLPDTRYTRAPLPEGGRWGRIVIGNDVWIGHRAYIRAGARLGDGCIVGALAVVTKDVPPYAIVAGNPARIVGYRFEPDVIEALLQLRWWRFDFRHLEGVDVTDVGAAIARIAALEAAGMVPYDPIPDVFVADAITPALACQKLSGSRADPFEGPR